MYYEEKYYVRTNNDGGDDDEDGGDNKNDDSEILATSTRKNSENLFEKLKNKPNRCLYQIMFLLFFVQNEKICHMR